MLSVGWYNPVIAIAALEQQPISVSGPAVAIPPKLEAGRREYYSREQELGQVRARDHQQHPEQDAEHDQPVYGEQ